MRGGLGERKGEREVIELWVELEQIEADVLQLRRGHVDMDGEGRISAPVTGAVYGSDVEVPPAGGETREGHRRLRGTDCRQCRAVGIGIEPVRIAGDAGEGIAALPLKGCGRTVVCRRCG